MPAIIQPILATEKKGCLSRRGTRHLISYVLMTNASINAVSSGYVRASKDASFLGMTSKSNCQTCRSSVRKEEPNKKSHPAVAEWDLNIYKG